MERKQWLIAATGPLMALALASPAAGASQPGRMATATPVALGNSWRTERATSLVARNGALVAASCAKPTACTAVGSHEISPSITGTLAEAWNGTNWRIQPTPNPASATSSLLTGVSCSSPSACTAVGIATSSTGVSAPLAERWNGMGWRIQSIPVPARAVNADLSGVSCASASTCIAVGGYTTSTGRSFELSELWNGTRWAIQVIPNPPGSAFKGLNGVSCSSARACTAVASYVPVGGHLITLAERWNGTRWAIQPTPNPPMRTAVLVGVSCSSASACAATGYSINSVETIFPLAETWNGASWHLRATPTPAGFAFFAPLPSVSCTSANACTAAGSWDNTTGSEFTLAERWNGTRWTIQATPNPVSTPASAFEGVSCPSPRVCVAAGGYGPAGSPGKTLAERWNGTRWSIQVSPNPTS